MTDHQLVDAPLAGYRYRRWLTREVCVGDVGIGGDNPIRVQSMTSTRTLDTEATVAQADPDGGRRQRAGADYRAHCR